MKTPSSSCWTLPLFTKICVLYTMCTIVQYRKYYYTKPYHYLDSVSFVVDHGWVWHRVPSLRGWWINGNIPAGESAAVSFGSRFVLCVFAAAIICKTTAVCVCTAFVHSPLPVCTLLCWYMACTRRPYFSAISWRAAKNRESGLVFRWRPASLSFKLVIWRDQDSLNVAIFFNAFGVISALIVPTHLLHRDAFACCVAWCFLKLILVKRERARWLHSTSEPK